MADANANAWPKTEQEEKLDANFNELSKIFKRLAKTNKPDKIHEMLKEVTNKLKESKNLIKDFEREARTDGMPAPLLADRKRALVQELNDYIAKKKDIGQGQADRDALMTGAQVHEEQDMNNMTMQQLMQKGRTDLKDTDVTLARTERLVEDTIQIGTQTAAALNDQTNQLNKIVDDLNEMEFTMKKATKVIKDITRGLLTDKCIGFLLFLVVGAVIAVIILKIVKPNKNAIVDGLNISTSLGDLINTAGSTVTNAASTVANTATTAASGRRLLREVVRMVLDVAVGVADAEDYDDHLRLADYPQL